MTGATEPRRLTRRPADGRIAGVCAGIAEYFDTDVTLVRLLWVILSIFPGTIVGGLIAYGIAWLLLPDPGLAAPRVYSGKPLLRSTTDRQIGGVCGGVAEFLELDSTLVRLAAVILAIFPGAIVCGVLVYAIAWFVIPATPARAWAPSTSPSS